MPEGCAQVSAAGALIPLCDPLRPQRSERVAFVTSRSTGSREGTESCSQISSVSPGWLQDPWRWHSAGIRQVPAEFSTQFNSPKELRENFCCKFVAPNKFTRSSMAKFCPWQRGWNEMIFKVTFHPEH